MPFFSRRIGLSREGQIMPIQFAGKVTSRIGDYNIGLLDAVLNGKTALEMPSSGELAETCMSNPRSGC